MAKIYDFDEIRTKEALNKIEEMKKDYECINDIENIVKSSKLSDEQKIMAIQKLFDDHYSEEN